MPGHISPGGPNSFPVDVSAGVPPELSGAMPRMIAGDRAGMAFIEMGGMPDGMPFPGMSQDMSARPYIGRALKLLGNRRSLVGLTLLLSLVATLLPFIYSAAFGPLVELLGRTAVEAGNWDHVWAQRGSLYS